MHLVIPKEHIEAEGYEIVQKGMEAMLHAYRSAPMPFKIVIPDQYRYMAEKWMNDNGFDCKDFQLLNEEPTRPTK